MSTQSILGLALAASIALTVWYFSSSSRLLPADVGIDVGENASTTIPATGEPAPAPTPAKSSSKPAAPKAPAGPVTSSSVFCPQFTATAKLGDSDTASGFVGGVATLQKFFMGTYSLPASSITGTFDATTEANLKRYQREMGLAQTGVLDTATQDQMLRPCVKGLIANGVEYPLKGFSLATSTVTESLYIRQGLIEAQSTIANGAYRIELMSVSGGAKLRVTGKVSGGLQSQVVTIQKGSKVTTDHSRQLTIAVTSLTASSATFVFTR